MGCGSAVLAGGYIGFVGISFAFGLSVLAMAYVIGGVSGCHIRNTEVLPNREDIALNPISPYAVSKLAAESYVRVFCRVYGLQTICLRYFNVYGPRQTSGVVEANICALVSDVGEVFNIASGYATTITELVKNLQKITNTMGSKVIYAEPWQDDTKHSYANISKAEKLLNYKPKVKLFNFPHCYLLLHQT
jgi:UDP-glucose 4-epimerase